MLETLPVWSNVQPQLQPHPTRCLKISKLGNSRKASRRSCSVFSNRFSQAICCAQHNSRYVLCPKHDAWPTMSFAVRLRHQEICFKRSPREPKTLHAHIVRARWSGKQFIAIKVGIGRHGEHVVARNVIHVKTQRDDGVLSAVSLTTMPLERRRDMRPVKVRLVK